MSVELLGLAELNKKLKKLEGITAKKHIRSALTYATSLEVKEMKAAAPRGSVTHRTYKGRLVAPGFLSRSIKRSTKIKDGVATQIIGVRKEAFYGVSFLDRGTSTITRRRVRKGRGREEVRIKPYSIKGKNWFYKNFTDSERVITDRFARKLKERVTEVIR